MKNRYIILLAFSLLAALQLRGQDTVPYPRQDTIRLLVHDAVGARHCSASPHRHRGDEGH